MTAIQQQGNLSGSPLSGHIDPRHFHPSPTHHEALARLHYLVEQHLRIGVLRGPAGCGKTMLLGRLCSELDPITHCFVNFSLLGLDLHDFLVQLAEGLFLNPRTDTPTVELWRKILDRLAEHRRQQWTTVLLWDNAHEAAPQVLAAISRLAEHDASLEARLTMILTADSRHVARLGERLLDRCALRVDVEPWEPEDTIEFLQHAIGCMQRLDDGDDQPSSFFTPEAMERLHAISGGIPRRVGQLAQWSLLAGAGLGMKQVDEETVAAAAEELGV